MKRKKLRKYISTLIAVVLLCGLATPSALAVSTSAIPISVNTSTYIRGYCVAVHDMAKQRTYVYTNSALTNRNENEYISAKTDEIRIIARSSKYDSVYVSYPTSKGRKKRWIPTAAVFSINSYKRMKAASSCKTYKFKSSSYSYGSISAGDIVYTYNTSGAFTRVIYPTGKTWKMAWVRTSDLNKSGNNQNNQQISARLNEMINGNFKNGVYKNHTTYKGPYAKEQCKGFAKSITQELFGYTIGSTQKKPYNYLINTTSKTRKVGAISSISNDSQLKSLLTQGRPGDFIQLRRRHGGSHSMILLSSSSSGISVFECNLDGKNYITTSYYSWATLRSKNAAIGLYTATNYSLH